MTDTESASTGHAAVGLVMGQRHDDGTRPEYVRIVFRRNGVTSNVIVRRDPTSPRVEFDETDSVRFETVGGSGTVIVDEVLEAEPARVGGCRA